MDDDLAVETELLRSTHTSASVRRGEVLAGPERRRRWSVEEKLRVLAQSTSPGSTPSLTCRLHGISTGQLSTWRKQFRSGALTGFVPVSITPDAVPAAAPDAVDRKSPDRVMDGSVFTGMIEIALPTGVRVRIAEGVGEAALRRVLAALS